MPEEPVENELDQRIIQIVKAEKPENVRELIAIIQAVLPRSKQEILGRIQYLQREEKIRLKPSQVPTQEKLTNYVFSSHARWYWVTMALTMATSIVVFTVPEDAFPLVYLRYVLGAVFVLWLPGYTFVKALFPKASETNSTLKELESIWRVALSIGTSLALVPMVGLLLNYTPWGISLTPIVLSLVALTVIFALAAVLREHQILISKKA